jgi:phenylacetate-coenzyme A ligase PaaK-like adenylate-forming protein
LANRVQPLIRYELGDQLIMATEPCDCGSRLPRIERILGRAGDVFRIPVGSETKILSAYPFQHAFDFLRDVREWQAVHRGENRIDVRFELLSEGVFDEVRARRLLNERMQMAGFGDALAINFHVVPRLEADPRTGKFRRMVCDESQPK